MRLTDYVIPVCLPYQGETARPATTAIVAGWGDTKTGNFCCKITMHQSITADYFAVLNIQCVILFAHLKVSLFCLVS